MIKAVFIGLLAILGLQAYGQIGVTAYQELPIENRLDVEYQTFLLGNQGVMVMNPSTDPIRGGQQKMIFSLYDTGLVKVWEKEYVLNNDEQVWGTIHQDSILNIITQKKGDQYRLMRIYLADGALELKVFPYIKDLHISHAKVNENKFIVAGSIDVSPVAMLLNVGDSTAPVILSSIAALRASVIDVVADSVQPYFYVLLDRKRPVSEPGIYVNRYDWNGRLLQSSDVRLSREYTLINYQAVMAADGQVLLMGSYTLGATQDAQGIYSMNIEHGQVTNNRFYDFGYLKNFFNYLPEKQRAKKISRIQKMLDSDKRMYHRYRVILHDLIYANNNRLVLVGDVIETNYQQQPNALYNPYNYYSYGNNLNLRYRYSPLDYPSSPYNTLSDPNQVPLTGYQHAFALGFSRDGNLIWDNSYVYEETKHKQLVEGVQVRIVNDTSVMVELKEDEILFKEAYQSQNDTTTNIQKITLEPSKEGDINEEIDYKPLQYWFGNNFMALGTKKVRNKQEEKPRRHVFFFEKITYGLPKQKDVKSPE